jgi:hypothetical protein
MRIRTVTWLAIAGAVALTVVLQSPRPATAAGPANDDFADAKVIAALPFSETRSNAGATMEESEPAPCGGAMTTTIWYRFTPADSGEYTFWADGSIYAHNLAVYTGGSLSSLALLSCDNNDGRGNSALLRRLQLQAGTTYRIQFGGSYGSSGNLVLNARSSSPPANDDFENSVSLVSLPFAETVDMLDSTKQPEEPGGTCGDSNDVWYDYTPFMAEKWVVVSTAGSDHRTQVEVWTGDSIDTLQLVTCDDHFGPDDTEWSGFRAPLVQGTTYRLEGIRWRAGA